MQLPKLSGLKEVVISPEAIAVYTAAILTPIIFPYVNKWIAKAGPLADHITIAMTIVAIIFFVLAMKIGHHIGRAILIGIGGAFLLIGFGGIITKYLPNTVIP